MNDSILTWLSAIMLAGALLSAGLAHTRRDDELRANLSECLDGWETSAALNETCLNTVEQARDLLVDGPCACWVPDEVGR